MPNQRPIPHVCPSALLGVVVLLVCSPLHGQQPGVQYSIFNGLSSKAIDAPLQCLSDGCWVQQWDWNLGSQQNWSLVPSDWPGFFSIVNQLSGKVIDVPTPACSGNNGCQVQQYDSNGSWQQQWTLVPTDSAGANTIINRLSGKALDDPTQCVSLNGCPLQQWDSNGGAQQQWSFLTQNTGSAKAPPPGGVTLLVNGSFDPTPSWVQTSDPEYQAIAATFGDQPIAYEWNPCYYVFVDPLDPYDPNFSYFDIYSGGQALAAYINSNIPPDQPLSIVAHSHGGNVVKVASHYLTRQIDYLVTLGTPQNWDLPEINGFAISTSYCEVSSLADYVQFGGASPGQQLEPFAYDQYEVALASDQLAQDVDQQCDSCVAYDLGQIALYEADAFFYWMSTKLALGAWNVLYTDLSHEDLHTAGVWGSITADCGYR